jgi:hypothetical protein
MLRRGSYQLWLVVLLVAAGAGLAGGVTRPDALGSLAGATPPPATAPTVMAIGLDVAVVPGRTDVAAPAPVGVHHSPGRSLVPAVAALTVAAGLALVAARRLRPRVHGQPAALRAPPFALV